MASAVLPSRNERSFAPPRGASGGVKKMGSSNGKTAKTPNFGKRQFQSQPRALARDLKDLSPEVVARPAASADLSLPSNRQSDHEYSQYVSFDISSRSKKELIELRSRFVAELDQIRDLRDRIESGNLSGRSGQNLPPPKRPGSKKLSGNKRPFPSISGKDAKRAHNCLDIGEPKILMKSCAQILTKLMKQKHAYVFNTPVDVVGMQLHDYHNIVKYPMDLGTVKSRLAQNIYSTPLEFADDVKLTFKNALLYNPIGHEVYVLAEQLLARFEELFQPVYKKIEDGQRQDLLHDEELLASSWTNVEVEPESVKNDSPVQMGKKPLPASSWSNVEPERVKKDKSMNIVKKSEQIPVPPPPQPSQSPVRTPEPVRAAPVKPLKQPKPKAKDPNKREMSLEEKHKLGVGLQGLPQEKMEHVVQIISKRNGHLSHDGDEIELDIEAIDTETLWELDRFVTNWKKAMSKIKRQALMNNNVGSGSGSGSVEQNEDVLECERIDVGMDAKTPKKVDGGDEDVDIDDDMPMNSYAPVEIEKDDGRVSSSSSSSSSSGSDSSSSSDSDSGSSSGSDSEADNAQS